MKVKSDHRSNFFFWLKSDLASNVLLLSSADRTSHRFTEVTGSNPVEALIFFRLLPSNCLNLKFTAMISLHFHLQPQYK